jgi:hypothetical protein
MPTTRNAKPCNLADKPAVYERDTWNPLLINGGTSYPSKSAMFRRRPIATSEEQTCAISLDFKAFLAGQEFSR